MKPSLKLTKGQKVYITLRNGFTRATVSKHIDKELDIYSVKVTITGKLHTCDRKAIMTLEEYEDNRGKRLAKKIGL